VLAFRKCLYLGSRSFRKLFKESSDFLKLIDNLFLFSIDVGIRPSLFAQRVQEFVATLGQFRQKYLTQTAEQSLNRALFDKNHRGEPYPKVFTGAITEVDERRHVTVREETQEEIMKRTRLLELAATKLDRNREANLHFAKINEGRMPVYLGEESVVWEPSRSAVEASDTKVLTVPDSGSSGQQS
jgi:hypothetical protein